MDTEFPGNSRNGDKSTVRPEKATPAAEEETKKLDKVVTGKVVRRKKPLGRRFMDTFFTGDSGLASYLGREVLLPALQDLVTDFVKQGVERAVYGDSRTPSRSVRGSSAPRTHISYDRYTASRPAAREATPARRSVTQTSSIDVGDIILERRVEADIICEKLYETVQEYGSVTVANLNDLLGQSSAYTDSRWGWTNLESLTVKRVREGFLLQLPEPEDLR